MTAAVPDVSPRMRALIAACGLLVSGFLSGLTAADPERVVVVANAADPGSLRVARHYAEKRAIPEANIIAIETSTEETVTVGAFVETVYNPLARRLIEGDWINGVEGGRADAAGRVSVAALSHKIDYLVLCRGIPVRFEQDESLVEDSPQLLQLPESFRVNSGSVDGELAMIAMPARPLGGPSTNPLFSGADSAGASLVVRVSRLDGPTAADAMALVDRALEAEEKGLRGRAYIDLRGPHATGDEWLKACGRLARDAHFDTDVKEGRWDWGDRIDAPALYFGWYAINAYGPFADRRWQVPPGAIGYHLHSYSATVLRSGRQRWVGPMVEAGFTATVGYVYEPFLELTIRPQLLLERLLEGASFGEAYYHSLPALSWQVLAVGDPLYRPFARDLDAQLAEPAGDLFDSYAVLRELNRLESVDDADGAVALARKAFLDSPSLALAYRLASLYHDQDRDDEARQALNFLRYAPVLRVDDLMLTRRIADLLGEMGEGDQALELYRRLLAFDKLPKPAEIALLNGGAGWARRAGDSSTATRWKLRAEQLRKPPEAN